MLLTGLLSFTHAAPAADPRVWVGAGLAGGVGVSDVPGGGGGAAVKVGVALGKDTRRSLGVVAEMRELWMSTEVRNIGNIGLVARYPASGGPYVALGFAHQHEALLADYLARPIPVTAGIDPAIHHRTGFEAGVGWDLSAPFPNSTFGHRFSPTLGLTAMVYPDPGGPPVYVYGELGIRFGVDGLMGR